MKKTRTPKKPAPQDWHKADIKAALEKAGWTLRKLSVAHGYHPCSFQRAFVTRWSQAEAAIAAAIGIDPAEIWPSRYAEKCNTPGKNQQEAA